MIGRHEEAGEPLVLQRPRKGKAVAQHKIRQQSKGQTARNRLAKEREQKCPVPGQLRIDHREWRQKRRKKPVRHRSEGERKTYVEHRPLRRAREIYGRAGTVGTESRVGEGARQT